MMMGNFIPQANEWGKTRTPFFFLIDFEQQKPLILKMDEAQTSGLFFDFFCKPDIVTERVNKPFEFAIQPLPFEKYQQKFNYVKNHIQNGNSYLLNLTCATKIQMNYSLEDIFKNTTAKYKCYLKDQFVCFSPECFIRIKKNKIYAYPMKGTINANEDDAKQKLMNSEKELTEHNTIVDLIRNDLALVSSNIQVTKYRYLEKIETHKGSIYQTSSEICGELAEHWQDNIGTILVKLLPAGSISGAPKLKTVEIIKQSEQEERGYYTGIFGYFDGENVESAVAIRYIEKKQDQYLFRSGGGITILSNINEEYNEILEKVYVPISSF